MKRTPKPAAPCKRVEWDSDPEELERDAVHVRMVGVPL